MKKRYLLTASAAALSFSGAAFAQTTDPVEPGGDAAAFFATAPASAGNQSTVTQRSAGNRADVDQTAGSQGVAIIDQGGSAANSGRNDAEIDQRGAGKNQAMIRQSSTTNTTSFGPEGEPVLPTGRDTPDRSNRDGFRQQAIVDQTNAGGNANSAVIFQGVAGVRGFQNEAIVRQNGSGNDAAVTQGGGTNAEDGRMFSNVDQAGDDNIAENVQGESDYSNIEQDGAGNQAYVDQRYNNGVYQRSSDVGQAGDGNIATVRQRAIGSQSSVLQGLRQAGSATNTATVLQNAGSVDAISVVRQDGDNNRASTTQSASASAFVDQIGQSNESIVNQSGASTASVNQFGDDGLSEVRQSAAGNSATVTQEIGSSEADSFVDQSGANNIAEVSQSGFSNESDILQTGVLNKAFVTQSTNNNASGVSQGGSGNTATVTQ